MRWFRWLWAVHVLEQHAAINRFIYPFQGINRVLLPSRAGCTPAFTCLVSYWPGHVPANTVLAMCLQELRSDVLQLQSLPVVMAMLERLGPADFVPLFLPQLQPVFEGAHGDMMGALVAQAPAFAKLMTQWVLCVFACMVLVVCCSLPGVPCVFTSCMCPCTVCIRYAGGSICVMQ